MYMRRGLNYITQANVKHRAQNGIDGFLEIIFCYFELNYKSNCHRSQWLLLRVLVAIFITSEPFRLYLIRDKLLVWIAISFWKEHMVLDPSECFSIRHFPFFAAKCNSNRDKRDKQGKTKTKQQQQRPNPSKVIDGAEAYLMRMSPDCSRMNVFTGPRSLFSAAISFCYALFVSDLVHRFHNPIRMRTHTQHTWKRNKLRKKVRGEKKTTELPCVMVMRWLLVGRKNQH